MDTSERMSPEHIHALNLLIEKATQNEQNVFRKFSQKGLVI